jgi:hypothetical protein
MGCGAASMRQLAVQGKEFGLPLPYQSPDIISGD